MIVIGVDVGGTSIKGGAINDKGEVLDTFSLRTDRRALPEVTFGLIADAINEFIKTHQYDEPYAGVGLGIPGLINQETGIVASSPNLPTWLNFNIKTFLEERIDLPIRVVNDASAAALGEAKFGCGKKHKYLLMITLGTGVGGGIVFNGQLIDGYMNMGAQLGHSIIQVNGRPCSCGRKGCLEAYCSATALVRETNRIIKYHPDTMMHQIVKEHGKVDARVAFMGDRLGDKYAHRLVEDYVKNLSEGLLSFCNIFRPEIIVLSGGVANEGDYLISRVKKYMEERDYGYKNAPEVIIKKAELGYDSGKIGAASLFFN